MASFKSAAAREYQETLVQERKDQQRQIEIVIDGLEVSVFGVLDGIESVMEAANLSDAEKVAATRALLAQRKTRDFKQLKDDLENAPRFKLRLIISKQMGTCRPAMHLWDFLTLNKRPH